MTSRNEPRISENATLRTSCHPPRPFDAFRLVGRLGKSRYGFGVMPDRPRYRPRLRPVGSLLIAGWFVLLASGMVLPFPATPTGGTGAHNAAERFPCENCPCGCGTAEHCWAACCCHTLEQRLDWARREGVRPPETALDDAQSRGLAVGDWRRGVAGAVARATGSPRPACCATKASCCSTPMPCCAAKSAPDRKASPPRGISLIQSLACRGLTQMWLSLGVATVTNPPLLVALPEGTTPSSPAPAALYSLTADQPVSPPPDA
jgi:hypothetical protein